MKIVLSAALVALVASPAIAAPKPVQMRTLTATSTQRSSADIDPVAKAHSTVYVTDDGNTLTLVGRGGGFVAGLAYLSLVYDNGSTPTGPGACLPGLNPSPVSPGAQMFVGYWLPITSRNRSLFVQKTGASYVPLGNIGTMSIRYDSQFFTNPVAASDPTQQNPGRLFLQSCGSL